MPTIHQPLPRRTLLSGTMAGALTLTGCLPDLPTPTASTPTPGASPSASPDVVTPAGSVRIEFRASNIASIRIAGPAGLGEFHSYAVIDQPDAAPQVERTQHGDLTTFSTDRLSVSVDGESSAITVTDAEGRAVCANGSFSVRDNGSLRWTHKLTGDESNHGLGSRAFGLDLRGHRYQLWNFDSYAYVRGTDPLYQSIPFLLGVRNRSSYGVLWDNPARGWVDVGAARQDRVTFAAETGELRLYVIAGDDPQEVLRGYGSLTGLMPLPPLWALGYHQSRWGYKSAAEFTRLAEQFRTRQIPCDALYFDIDYMDEFRLFTWNRLAFPDPPRLLKQLHDKGFKTVAIVDPGIKVDPRYAAYQELKDQKLFLTTPDGAPATGRVWPDLCRFPDFSNPATRTWWAGRISGLVTDGLDGIWNDMNEPSLFSPPASKTLPDDVVHQADGRLESHRAAGHNVYGLQMAQASRDGQLAASPDKRPFTMTRAGHAGVQRYATTWTGDNRSTWDHLRLSITMVMNQGLSGIGFSGSDSGGFKGAPDAELYTRWIQVSSMMPYFRTHSSESSPTREPWSFGTVCEARVRSAIEWRYRLLPYFYSVAQEASSSGVPMVRPLFFDDPSDKALRSIEDQFLVGDALLVAPVVEQGARQRLVHLPRGTWYDFHSGEAHPGNRQITVAAPLDRLPLFVRAGQTIPLWPVRQSTSGGLPRKLELWAHEGAGTSWWYEDAGDGYDFLSGASRQTTLTSTLEGGTFTLTSARSGALAHRYREVAVHLRGSGKRPSRVLVDSQPVPSTFTDGVTTITTTGFGSITVLTR